MATDSAVRSVSNTLTTTVADTITLTQAWPSIRVTNSDASNILWVRQDGTTAVALADNASPVPVSSSRIFRTSLTSAGTSVISVVGSGGAYIVEGVNSYDPLG